MSRPVKIVNFAKDSGLRFVGELERVLDSIPQHLLVGLDRIVLRLASDMTESERRKRGRSGRLPGEKAA